MSDNSKNRKRSSYISFLKRKNYKLSKEIDQFIEQNNFVAEENNVKFMRNKLTDIQIEHLTKLQRLATQCSNFSLYASEIASGDFSYITSATCDHKCCFVCNWNRQKAIRRKYYKWFVENPTILKINTGTKTKFVTNAQFKEKYSDATIESEIYYDLMHLTLTVPHYFDTGFNNDKFYYSKIIELFNWMRKDEQWLKLVFGGEYGVETEKKLSGLHIHIHALLMVHPYRQNRNILHKYIFKKWNALTVNQYSKRNSLSAYTCEKIKASNSTIDDDFIRSLNPKGATILGLEPIYSLQDGKKVRSNIWASDAMMKAILETISYHFEPHAFNKDENSINIELLSELLPELYRKILYKKFGVLHGEKALNISANLTEDELLENLKEASELLIDEETGEITPARQYFVVNPAYIYHDMHNDNKIVLSNLAKAKMRILDSVNSHDAIVQMSNLVKVQYGHTPDEFKEKSDQPEPEPEPESEIFNSQLNLQTSKF